MDIAKLIAESKALLAFRPKDSAIDIEDFTRRYLEPERVFKSFNLLAPVGFEWRSELEEWYPPFKPGWYKEESWCNTVVVHGHVRGQVCQNRDLCHILGFQPVGNEHPWFLKEWKKFDYDS